MTYLLLYVYTSVWVDTCIISLEIHQGSHFSLVSPCGRHEVQRGGCLDVGAGNLSNLLAWIDGKRRRRLCQQGMNS